MGVARAVGGSAAADACFLRGDFDTDRVDPVAGRWRAFLLVDAQGEEKKRTDRHRAGGRARGRQSKRCRRLAAEATATAVGLTLFSLLETTLGGRVHVGSR